MYLYSRYEEEVIHKSCYPNKLANLNTIGILPLD